MANKQTADCAAASLPVVADASSPAVGIRFIRWLRLMFSFPVMLACLIPTIQFVLSRGSIADPDIWWHLRNAETLIQHHQLPRYDVYSFTVAGHPWINTEWLSELPYYVAWHAWGLVGIEIVRFLVIFAIFMGVLYLCYRESGNIKASALSCCFCTLLAVVSFGPRTILFGYVYLVAMLIILQRFRRIGRGPLWLIPLIFCLWVNTHGSWLVGLILFSIVVAAGLVKGTWGRVDAEPWSRIQLRKLFATGGASVAALFINPFGWRAVVYPFDLAFRQKLNVSHVAEWVSVNFHEGRGKVVLLVIVALLLSALLRPGRWTLTELGLLLFALYSGLTYVRFLFLLAIVVAPLIAKIVDFVPPYQPEIDKPILNAALILIMIGGMVWYWPRSAELQRSVDQSYPAGALSFLKVHPPTGPMLNFYLWGGYMGWQDRNLKVFLDSRVDIFEYAGVLSDYLDLLAIHEPEAILAKYNIRYVLFPPGEPLTHLLEHDPNWSVLYRDNLSVLLERTDTRSAGTAPAAVSPGSSGFNYSAFARMSRQTGQSAADSRVLVASEVR